MKGRTAKQFAILLLSAVMAFTMVPAASYAYALNGNDGSAAIEAAGSSGSGAGAGSVAEGTDADADSAAEDTGAGAGSAAEDTGADSGSAAGGMDADAGSVAGSTDADVDSAEGDADSSEDADSAEENADAAGEDLELTASDPEIAAILEKIEESEAWKGGLRPAVGEGTWTFAVYVCGSDLERDNGFATSDLLEMIEANVPANLNLIVLTGGAGDGMWDPEKSGQDVEGYVEPKGTEVWHITDTGMNLLYDFDGKYQDLSDAGVAETFFKLATDYAPAEHMMVGFWDHGGGPIKGAEYAQAKDGSDVAYIQTTKLCQAVQNASEYRAERFKDSENSEDYSKFDIVGFDNCLMNSVEIAYDLSDSADYLVASEEVEPGDGWNYLFLEAFGDYKDKLTDKDDICRYIGQRIIQLYSAPTGEAQEGEESRPLLPYSEAVPAIGSEDKLATSPAGKKWIDYDYNFLDGTMALVDLSGMDGVVDALNDLGKALNAIYASKDTEAGESDWIEVTKAVDEVKYLSDGKLGQVDIYLLAQALYDKDITGDLSSAAKDLIAAVGEGEEIRWIDEPVTFEDEDAEQVPAGQLGAVDTDGAAVLYRGLTSSYAGGIGMAMFFPLNLDVEPVYIDAVTGNDRTAESYGGVYNDVYKGLAFAKSAQDYKTFIDAVAGLQDASRNAKIKPDGTITADTDQNNVVYMGSEGMDASKFTKVLVEMSLQSADAYYYLGNRIASYNEDAGRYEAGAQHDWLRINGNPVTYESTDDKDEYKVPVVLIKDNAQDGRFTEREPGSKVDPADICYITLIMDPEIEGDARIRSWTDPKLSYTFIMAGQPNGIKFQPLLQEIVTDEEGNVSRGDYIAGEVISSYYNKHTFEMDGYEIDLSSHNVKDVTLGSPSGAAGYLLNYNFKAYDKNTTAYISNSVFTVEMDWDQLSIDPIADQKYTGSAVTPELSLTFHGETGYTIDMLNAFYEESVILEAKYSDNVQPGTGKVTVTVTDRAEQKVLKTLEAAFNIVSGLKKGDEVAYGGNTYIVLDEPATAVALVKAKNKRSVAVPATITASGQTLKVTQIAAGSFKGKKIRTVTIGANVSTIKANAFRSSKATRLIVKTKLLKKSTVKNSLKGSRIRTVKVKVGKRSLNKKYAKKYRKIFTKSNAGKKVRVRA